MLERGAPLVPDGCSCSRYTGGYTLSSRVVGTVQAVCRSTVFAECGLTFHSQQLHKLCQTPCVAPQRGKLFPFTKKRVRLGTPGLIMHQVLYAGAPVHVVVRDCTLYITRAAFQLRDGVRLRNVAATIHNQIRCVLALVVCSMNGLKRTYYGTF